MNTLRFDGKAVVGLIDDAKRSAKHYMTMLQRDERFGVDTPVPGEEDHAPAGLWFVKDEGIYLMSNSFPKRGGPVYARGYGKHADWDKVRAAAGGDDFVEFIEITPAIETALKGPGVFELQINLTASTMDIGVVELLGVERPQREEGGREI
ncbi:MAG: DUF3085 domain-containing protein [Candidatus Dormibacteria bacterium]